MDVLLFIGFFRKNTALWEFRYIILLPYILNYLIRPMCAQINESVRKVEYPATDTG